MDLLESYYGKQTFLLYSLLAKVPGSRSWPRKIFVTLSILLLLWGTVCQVTRLIVEKFSRDSIIELLPTTVATIGIMAYVPYVAFATEEKYGAMLSVMLNDLREARNEEADAIKREYANSAKMLTNALTVIIAVALCSMPMSVFLPSFLDVIMPLNETREKPYFIEGEFFVDKDQYFYHIYFLESSVVIVVGIVLGVNENMSVIIGQHYCGMIAALGNQLENITRIEKLDKLDCTLLIENRTKVCINRHHTILQFGVMIINFYDLPLTLILIGMFTSMTVMLVQITDLELMNMTMITFTIAQIVQLFLLSYMGQAGINASEQISVYAYNAPWYVCPANTQKSLQLMILRASKPCVVVATGMYALTLANFMSVMQTVSSFYMVLRRTQ